jgi:hypothetical protein
MMGVGFRNKDFARLEVIASRGAQTGHVPNVVGDHRFPVHVTAYLRALTADVGEPHEDSRVRRTAAERPASGNNIAAVDCSGFANRAG